MKTPREILLERHQAVVPKLDVIRREIVNAEFRRRDFTAAILNWPFLFWRELIFPSRRIWTSLTAIWVLLFIFNFSQRDRSSIVTATTSVPAMMSFGEQQKLLNELLADRSLPMDADRPKTFLPKPRTETAGFLTA